VKLPEGRSETSLAFFRKPPEVKLSEGSATPPEVKLPEGSRRTETSSLPSESRHPARGEAFRRKPKEAKQVHQAELLSETSSLPEGRELVSERSSA